MENQNVELKEKWRDEYLKWVSAFANSQGGVLVIGKNDRGELVGAGKREPTIEFKYNREFSVIFYSDANITIKDTKNLQTNGTQNSLLAMMGENPRITVKTMATALGINERNVKNHIRTLKDLGCIERIGANKGGYWVVKLPG